MKKQILEKLAKIKSVVENTNLSDSQLADINEMLAQIEDMIEGE